jgi:hypothetical protein
MNRLLLSCVLAACLAATARAAPFDPAAEPASVAADFIKSDRLSALAGVKKVAIANFRVEFAVENSSKAQSSGSKGWSSSASDVKLAGIDDEQRRAITDQLYDKLVQDLSAAGLEIVPYDTLREAEAYKAMAPVLKTSLEPVGTRQGKSVFVGARGMPTYFTNDDRHLGLGALLGGISTVQPQNHEPAIAKALDAAVLRATLVVAFAEQSKSGGLFRSASSVETKLGLAIVPELTQYLFVTPDGSKARVYLANAVVLPDDVLTLRDTTTQSEKTTQVVANLITGLLAGGVRSERHYEAAAVPEAYAAAVTRYGQAVAGAAVSLLRGALPPKTP